MVADEEDLPALEDEARRLVDHLKTLNAVNEGLGAAAGRVDGATASHERVREDLLAATGLLDETRASADAVLAQVRELDLASLRGAIDERFDRQEAAHAERDRALDARLGALEAAQRETARTVGVLLTALGETEQRLLRDAEQRQRAATERQDAGLAELREVASEVLALKVAVAHVGRRQDAIAEEHRDGVAALLAGQREASKEVQQSLQAARMQLEATQHAIAESRDDVLGQIDEVIRASRVAFDRARKDRRTMMVYVVLLIWLALVVYALTEHGLLTQLLRRGG